MDSSSTAPIGQLLRDAAELRLRIESTLKKPAALMLPADARQAIRDLAALVERLAVEVEACKAGNRSS